MTQRTKHTTYLICLLAATAIASGYLMSRSTWIGKVGMTLFHKGYNFTKVWWQGAIAVALFFAMFYILHTYLHERLRATAGKIAHFLILLAAAAGLYLTHQDFTTDFTHRALGHRFHYGFYLIWIGWITICVSFLLRKKELKLSAINRDSKETAGQ